MWRYSPTCMKVPLQIHIGLTTNQSCAVFAQTYHCLARTGEAAAISSSDASKVARLFEGWELAFSVLR
jgi:hypothetical protein